MELTKFETARIVGARALQLSMGAPLLVKFTKQQMATTKYNPIEVAKIELNKKAIPISVVRPKPGHLSDQAGPRHRGQQDKN